MVYLKRSAAQRNEGARQGARGGDCNHAASRIVRRRFAKNTVHLIKQCSVYGGQVGAWLKQDPYVPDDMPWFDRGSSAPMAGSWPVEVVMIAADVGGDDFLAGIFADAEGSVVIAKPTKDKGHFQRSWCRGDAATLAPGAWYWCCSTSKAAARVDRDGVTTITRRKSDLARTCAIVLDDIGTKVETARVEQMLPPPSAIIETSPGNFQWVYILGGGADPQEAATALERLAAAEVTDAGAKDASHIFRLPGSINDKAAVLERNGGQPWSARVTLWAPERRYTLDEIVERVPQSAEPKARRKVDANRGQHFRSNRDHGLDILQRFNMVLGQGSDGGINIKCPWSGEHSGETSDSATTYWPPKSGDKPGFKCLHGHCEHRRIRDLHVWLRAMDPTFDPRPLLPNGEAKPNGAAKSRADVEVAKKIEWTEPEPLISDAEPPPPYPIEALPDLMRHAVEEVQRFAQTPVEMVASSAMSAVSISAQHLVDVRRTTALQGPNGLYYLIIADSGDRKTTLDRFFMAPIIEYERQEREKGKATEADHAAEMAVWEAKKQAATAKLESAAKGDKALEGHQADLAQIEKDKPAPPRIPRIIYADATQEKLLRNLATGWPSAGIVSSEGGAVFGAHAMGRNFVMRTFGALNVLWDGGTLQVDRVSGGSFVVRGARLSINLQVQPAVLRDFMEGTRGLARGSGFLARFLLVAPETRQGTRMFREAPASWPALTKFNTRIGALLAAKATTNDDGTLSPTVLDFSNEAKAAWIESHDEIEKAIGPTGEFVDVRDVAAKAADNIARMAALFHCLDARNGYGNIGPEAVRSAAAVVIWHLYAAKHFLGPLSSSPEESRAAALDGWLRAHCRREGGTSVPTRTVQRYGPIRDRKPLDEALEALAEASRAKSWSRARSAWLSSIRPCWRSPHERPLEVRQKGPATRWSCRRREGSPISPLGSATPNCRNCRNCHCRKVSDSDPEAVGDSPQGNLCDSDSCNSCDTWAGSRVSGGGRGPPAGNTRNTRNSTLRPLMQP